MKRIIILGIVVGNIALLSTCATKDGAQTTETSGIYTQAAANNEPPTNNPWPTADGWPISFNDGNTSYTIFEPQCDSWDGHEMAGRSALAVQAPGQAQPVYGVISFNAITLVDKATRTASLADFKLISADFPSARNQTQNYLVPILIRYSKNTPPLALDRLESNLALPEAPKPERLNNAPPKIIIASRPAVLVYIDGQPAWRPVSGTGLERAINTRMLLLRDKAGTDYLHLFDGYLEAPSFDGPWKAAGHPPSGADVAEKLAVDSGQVDLMSGSPDVASGKAPSLSFAPVPDVYIATQPSELIQFRGPAEFSSIPGTDLLYVANTSGNVFKLLTDQQTYVLISGRWYRSPSLSGPWQFVPGSQLPRDFADIPDGSPKENVKASVPGTPQAEEALIENSIPQSTAVARSGSMPDPTIDGAMQLAAIEGTPLHYVVNSPTPIIEVNPQSWYACQDGVWYDSTAANGPWTVATSVPAVIYSIPPDSPLHYVTYVQVYGSTADQAYDGYTPGYMGTEVGDDGTVVYGTGYDYPAWIGAQWYGPPITWGWGFNNCWTPDWGWGFGCGFGWGWGGFGGFGCYPPHPWWGGYSGWHNHWGDPGGNWGHGNFAHTGGDFYHHDGQLGANSLGGHFHPAEFNRNGQAWSAQTGQFAYRQQGQVQIFGRNAWSQSRPGWSSGNRFGAYKANLPARNYAWNGAGRGVAPSGFRSWSAPGQTWYNPGFQNRVFISPGSAGMNQNFFNGGARVANNFGGAPGIGGQFHGMGPISHGGGSFPGGGSGGFHGGGGGGGHGGGGGGGHGR